MWNASPWPWRPCAATLVPRSAQRGGWRAHKIVEMLRWQQWTGEYGGVDGDPGSSDGSASWRRRRRRA